MALGISTRWNASRHTDGARMLDEIAACGFSCVELGYDLSPALLPGVRACLASGGMTVASVHSYCPVPLDAVNGNPELFSLADWNPRGRQRAIERMDRTLQLAGELGARYVVVHAGQVRMRRVTPKLIRLADAGQNTTRRYERLFARMLDRRAARAPRALERLDASLDVLIPRLEAAGVRLAFENAPDWETLPSEPELAALLARYRSPVLCVWYDTGHGQIRENLGLINQKTWLDKLRGHIAGFHVHDVAPIAHDHLPPGKGRVDFSVYRPFVTPDMPLILEPTRRAPREAVQDGATFIRDVWGLNRDTAA